MSYFDTLNAAKECSVKETIKKGFLPCDNDLFTLQSVNYETYERRSIELTNMKTGRLSKMCLQLVIYRMSSGKYELVNYIN
jgi:hypothetical protein